MAERSLAGPLRRLLNVAAAQALGKLHAAKDRDEVAKITQAHLDRLIEFVKQNPKSADLPMAIKSIAALYEAQGKTIEANAWRDKLPGR